jgi:hypothetical protein
MIASIATTGIWMVTAYRTVVALLGIPASLLAAVARGCADETRPHSLYLVVVHGADDFDCTLKEA